MMYYESSAANARIENVIEPLSLITPLVEKQHLYVLPRIPYFSLNKGKKTVFFYFATKGADWK